jgi:tetratricopeptide (TPR) repeat protein
MTVQDHINSLSGTTQVPQEEIMQNKNSSVSEFQAGMDLLEGDEYQSIFEKLNSRLEQCQDPVNRALITLDFFEGMKRFYNSACGTFNSAIVQHKNSQGFFYKGVSSVLGETFSFGPQSFLDNAMARLNSASILNRRDPLPCYVRSKIWYHKRDLDEALDEATKAVELSRRNSPYLEDFQAQVEFLQEAINKHDPMEFNIGRISYTSIKDDYERQQGITSDDGWVYIDWDHRFKIREGAILREYVSPVRVPNESFSKEYTVKKEPHETVQTHYRVKGMPIEMMEFTCHTSVQTHQFFDNEIWIKKSTLKHPYRDYFDIAFG